MKFILLSYFLFFTVNENFAQERLNSKDSIKTFIIVKKQFVDSVYSDSINNIIRKEWEKPYEANPRIYQDSLIQTAPSPAPFYSMGYSQISKLFFHVYPDYFVEYEIITKSSIENQLNNPLKKIYRIDRKANNHRTIYPITGEYFDSSHLRDKRQINFESAYNIVQINKNETKNILGYKCYKVILSSKLNQEFITILYVTDNIKLEYNPIANWGEKLKEFYPLYKKQYYSYYPDDRHTIEQFFLIEKE